MVCNIMELNWMQILLKVKQQCYLSFAHECMYSLACKCTGCPTTNRRCWFWITDKRLKIIQFCFLSVDVTYLGFCLRPKSSISEHWSSQNVKIRWGGHFEIKWKKNRDSFYWTLLTFLFLLRFIMFCNANNKLLLKIKVIFTILETLPFINWFF